MPDPRTEPVSVKVLLTTGEGVVIEWRDAHQSRYTFPYLREQCPCATRRERPARPPARGRRAQGQSVGPRRVRGALPMYQEPARALRAEPVGHYAVHFDFSDGHGTGIYSFEYFRRICPCEECKAAREAQEE